MALMLLGIIHIIIVQYIIEPLLIDGDVQKMYMYCVCTVCSDVCMCMCTCACSDVVHGVCEGLHVVTGMCVCVCVMLFDRRELCKITKQFIFAL